MIMSHHNPSSRLNLYSNNHNITNSTSNNQLDLMQNVKKEQSLLTKPNNNIATNSFVNFIQNDTKESFSERTEVISEKELSKKSPPSMATSDKSSSMIKNNILPSGIVNHNSQLPAGQHSDSLNLNNNLTVIPTKLYVTNFPYTCTQRQVHELFSRFGQVVECTLKKDYYAYIQYSNSRSAHSAYKNANGLRMLGRKLTVHLATSKKSQSHLNHTTTINNILNTSMTENGSTNLSSQSNGTTNFNSVGNQQTSVILNNINSTKIIHIRNFPESCSQQQIRECFKSYGEIIECLILHDSYAFVHFKLIQDARNALQATNNLSFMQHNLLVQYSRSKFKQQNSYQNQMSQGQSDGSNHEKLNKIYNLDEEMNNLNVDEKKKNNENGYVSYSSHVSRNVLKKNPDAVSRSMDVKKETNESNTIKNYSSTGLDKFTEMEYDSVSPVNNGKEIRTQTQENKQEENLDQIRYDYSREKLVKNSQTVNSYYTNMKVSGINNRFDENFINERSSNDENDEYEKSPLNENLSHSGTDFKNELNEDLSLQESIPLNNITNPQEKDSTDYIPNDRPAVRTKLYVTNFPEDMDQEEMKKLFNNYGNVLECTIMWNQYAFVHFGSYEEAEKALLAIKGVQYKGCKISVQWSTSAKYQQPKQIVNSSNMNSLGLKSCLHANSQLGMVLKSNNQISLGNKSYQNVQASNPIKNLVMPKILERPVSQKKSTEISKRDLNVEENFSDSKLIAQSHLMSESDDNTLVNSSRVNNKKDSRLIENKDSSSSTLTPAWSLVTNNDTSDSAEQESISNNLDINETGNTQFNRNLKSNSSTSGQFKISFSEVVRASNSANHQNGKSQQLISSSVNKITKKKENSNRKNNLQLENKTKIINFEENNSSDLKDICISKRSQEDATDLNGLSLQVSNDGDKKCGESKPAFEKSENNMPDIEETDLNEIEQNGIKDSNISLFSKYSTSEIQSNKPDSDHSQADIQYKQEPLKNMLNSNSSVSNLILDSSANIITGIDPQTNNTMNIQVQPQNNYPSNSYQHGYKPIQYVPSQFQNGVSTFCSNMNSNNIDNYSQNQPTRPTIPPSTIIKNNFGQMMLSQQNPAMANATSYNSDINQPVHSQCNPQVHYSNQMYGMHQTQYQNSQMNLINSNVYGHSNTNNMHMTPNLNSTNMYSTNMYGNFPSQSVYNATQQTLSNPHLNIQQPVNSQNFIPPNQFNHMNNNKQISHNIIVNQKLNAMQGNSWPTANTVENGINCANHGNLYSMNFSNPSNNAQKFINKDIESIVSSQQSQYMLGNTAPQNSVMPPTNTNCIRYPAETNPSMQLIGPQNYVNSNSLQIYSNNRDIHKFQSSTQHKADLHSHKKLDENYIEEFSNNLRVSSSSIIPGEKISKFLPFVTNKESENLNIISNREEVNHFNAMIEDEKSYDEASKFNKVPVCVDEFSASSNTPGISDQGVSMQYPANNGIETLNTSTTSSTSPTLDVSHSNVVNIFNTGNDLSNFSKIGSDVSCSGSETSSSSSSSKSASLTSNQYLSSAFNYSNYVLFPSNPLDPRYKNNIQKTKQQSLKDHQQDRNPNYFPIEDVLANLMR